MNDDRTVLGSYWDGVVGGVCVGLSVAVILYIAWQVGAAWYAGRFPL